MIGPGALELLQRVVIAPVDVRDPAISPGAGSLGGLAPLLFQAGSTEVLLASVVKTVQQVRAAGGWPSCRSGRKCLMSGRRCIGCPNRVRRSRACATSSSATTPRERVVAAGSGR